MAVDEQVVGWMKEHSNRPLPTQYLETMNAERSKAAMDERINLSNLATAEQDRAATGMEMEQSADAVALEKQKMQKYGALAAQIQNEPDPAKRYEMAKSWYSIAAEHNDTVGMQMAVPMLKQYSPEMEYGNQQATADANLASVQADAPLKKAQTAGQYADISYQNTMGQAAMLRAQGKGTIKYAPLQAQEKDDIVSSMSGQEWFKDLGGSYDKKSREIKPGTAKAQAAGDIALGVDYLRKKASEQGVDLAKEDAYGRLLSAIQTEGESPVVTNSFSKNDWDRTKFQDVLNNEVLKLSRVGEQQADEAVNGVFVNEAGELVDADGNPVDASKY